MDWRKHTACSILALVMSVWASGLMACSIAPPPNKPVAMASETAVIVWDEKSRTQHFIRTASFSTAAEHFGFMVPTPNRPELKEAADDAFVELARITAPKVVEKPRPSSGGCAIGCGLSEKAPGEKDSVQVLERSNVSGFDYAILKASDAGEL